MVGMGGGRSSSESCLTIGVNVSNVESSALATRVSKLTQRILENLLRRWVVDRSGLLWSLKAGFY
jgi:hypothetical protein